MAEVVLREVSKTYGEGPSAVTRVSVDVQDGEFVILVGPSGCGKSTLLRMIAGLETVSEGEIYIGDQLVNEVAAKDRDIAMVFQNYALYPHMTVYGNMAFGLKMRKFSKSEIARRVHLAAEILELGDLLDRKPKALSGGQRQRVAVGRAIVRQPKVFLFDEPLSNLDAQLRVAMRAELIKLHKRLGTTMIYVTHDQMEAMSMGDRLIVLRGGDVQQVGAPLEIYHHPANQFVAGFIGSPSMNFITGSVVHQEGHVFFVNDTFRVKFPDNKIPAPLRNKSKASKVILGIRPEDIFERAHYQIEGDENLISATVEILEPMGSEVLATCALGNDELIVRLSPNTRAKMDERIELALDMQRVKLFDPVTEEALDT